MRLTEVVTEVLAGPVAHAASATGRNLVGGRSARCTGTASGTLFALACPCHPADKRRVCWACANAFGAIRPAVKAAPVLVRLLRDNDSFIRCEAAGALAAIQGR